VTTHTPPVRSRPRRAAALILSFVLAAAAVGQPPPPAQPQAKEKDKDKDKTPPEEQKALDAFRSGKVDEAYKILQAAAKANPDLDPPRLILSRWFLAANQGQQARVWLEQAAAEEPDHPAILLTNASYALGEGRVTDCILNCQAALGAIESTRWSAEMKRRVRREARLGLVTGLETRGNFEVARRHLIDLVESDPKNPEFRRRLGRANFMVNRADDAFQDFQAAFKEDPTLPPPELEVANLWKIRGDAKEAEAWFNKAIKNHPNSAKVFHGFTAFLLDEGRAKEAQQQLAAAQKLDPNSRETRGLSGLMARYNRDYKGAARIFEELMRDHPNFPYAVGNMALALADQDDPAQKKRVVDLAELFVQLNPRDPNAYGVLGYCLLKAGRDADAERAVTQAAGMGQVSLDTGYFLALVLSKTGKPEEAYKVLRGALDGKGPFVYRPDAQKLLAELEKKVPPPKK
jgi:tetratricopeptide (TPR) repeat protein